MIVNIINIVLQYVIAYRVPTHVKDYAKIGSKGRNTTLHDRLKVNGTFYFPFRATSRLVACKGQSFFLHTIIAETLERRKRPTRELSIDHDDLTYTY